MHEYKGDGVSFEKEFGSLYAILNVHHIVHEAIHHQGSPISFDCQRIVKEIEHLFVFFVFLLYLL